MALFFFISAYVLVGSFDRKGRQRFLRDRFVRIGISLFGIVVFVEILIAAVGANPPTFSFGWGWLLVFLLILAVAYSVWRMLHITIPPVPCPGNGALLLAALALGAVNFAVRGHYRSDYWMLLHAIEPAHVPLYVLFMVAGILAYRNGWLEVISSALVKSRGIITVVGTCGIPVFIALIGIESLRGGITLAALLYAFWEAFLSIGICTCLLLVFKHRWNTTGRIKGAFGISSKIAVTNIEKPRGGET